MREKLGDNTSVPVGLMYDPPRKEDFPPRTKTWRDGLRNVLAAVESSRCPRNPLILFMNEEYVCTYDMYPKARYHVLLMPRRKSDGTVRGLGTVDALNDLESSHLSELKEFHELGANIARRLVEFHENSPNHSAISFMLGYHALPSLEPLHLHIISSDLDSPCITKRDHIVSFISPLFFVEPLSVERHLASAFADSVVLSVRTERARDVRDSTPMTCLRCGRNAASVPDWKRHNVNCHIEPLHKSPAGLLNSLLGWKRLATPDH
ncbi:hypothetical protein ACHAWF_012544 [Thalassiosira exigua]